MICKCGATVKASGAAPGATRSRGPFLWAIAAFFGRLVSKMDSQGRNRSRQDCGTIEVRSNEDTVASADAEWRSPLRRNSIRRSKALE
jgi:hypothetical protein